MVLLNTFHANVQHVMASDYYLQCYTQHSQWGSCCGGGGVVVFFFLFFFFLHANLAGIDVIILELLAGDIH